VWQNFAILRGKKIEKNILSQIPFFGGKSHQKNPKNHPKFSPAYNRKGTLRLFLFSYFEYCQIWLNVLIDDVYNP
jgi:hypothetical protein